MNAIKYLSLNQKRRIEILKRHRLILPKYYIVWEGEKLRESHSNPVTVKPSKG